MQSIFDDSEVQSTRIVRDTIVDEKKLFNWTFSFVLTCENCVKIKDRVLNTILGLENCVKINNFIIVVPDARVRKAQHNELSSSNDSSIVEQTYL